MLCTSVRPVEDMFLALQEVIQKAHSCHHWSSESDASDAHWALDLERSANHQFPMGPRRRRARLCIACSHSSLVPTFTGPPAGIVNVGSPVHAQSLFSAILCADQDHSTPRVSTFGRTDLDFRDKRPNSPWRNGRQEGMKFSIGRNQLNADAVF